MRSQRFNPEHEHIILEERRKMREASKQNTQTQRVVSLAKLRAERKKLQAKKEEKARQKLGIEKNPEQKVDYNKIKSDFIRELGDTGLTNPNKTFASLLEVYRKNFFRNPKANYSVVIFQFPSLVPFTTGPIAIKFVNFLFANKAIIDTKLAGPKRKKKSK